jgi:predicted transcriptional regulator
MSTLTPNWILLSQIIEECPAFVTKLPKMEQELCDFYLVKRFNQKEIASLLGITQGAISSRLTKIRKRLKFMKYLSSFDISTLNQILSPLFSSFEIELMRGMLETTCQTETARRLNVLFNLTEKPIMSHQRHNSMNQVKVRHLFEKCLHKLSQHKHPYYDLFLAVKQNLYMLHAVKLPQFNRRLG